MAEFPELNIIIKDEDIDEEAQADGEETAEEKVETDEMKERVNDLLRQLDLAQEGKVLAEQNLATANAARLMLSNDNQQLLDENKRLVGLTCQASGAPATVMRCTEEPTVHTVRLNHSDPTTIRIPLSQQEQESVTISGLYSCIEEIKSHRIPPHVIQNIIVLISGWVDVDVWGDRHLTYRTQQLTYAARKRSRGPGDDA